MQPQAATTTPLNNQAVVAAHLAIAQIQHGRNKFDWYGRHTGKPIARPSQIPPDTTDWFIWVLLGGRGFGKTRSASEWVRDKIKQGVDRVAFVGPTAADVRDVMVNGESGIMAVSHESDRLGNGDLLGRPKYYPSKRCVMWPNGASATLYSAEEPERLRGPQHAIAWGDEICAWQRMEDTWNMLMFGLRLGNNPQVVLSTTPKPSRLLRGLVANKTSVVSGGSTYENEANLAPQFISQIRERYEDTSLGAQEIYAQILDEAEGALWRREMIDKSRVNDCPDLKAICVSIDPAVTDKEDSNETGIIVVGTDGECGYVLRDVSGRYSPLAWAHKAVEVFNEYQADYFLAEVNNGGDLVIANLRNVLPNAPVRTVHARKGKYLRAEPVAALYEQGKVKHVRCRDTNGKVLNDFEALEMQMVTWEPLGDVASPDRLDALVHGLTSLMLKGGAADDDIAAPRGSKTIAFTRGGF